MWVSQSTRALASLPGLSLLELISAPHLLKGAVLKVLPRESSPCPAAPRDQHGHGFWRLWRGHWLSLHICSWSPTDLVSWDYPDLGQRLRAAGPRVTAPLRTQYTLQTKAPDGFDHHLFTLVNLFCLFVCLPFFICFTFELWYFPIHCEYELLIWYMICNFSVGYLFILLIVEETTTSLFCCLRNLVNFIWLCILEFD